MRENQPRPPVGKEEEVPPAVGKEEAPPVLLCVIRMGRK